MITHRIQKYSILKRKEKNKPSLKFYKDANFKISDSMSDFAFSIFIESRTNSYIFHTLNNFQDKMLTKFGHSYEIIPNRVRGLLP